MSYFPRTHPARYQPSIHPALKIEDDISVLKFAVIAHRHKAFKPYRQVLVLQQTNIGQPLNL